MNGEPIDLQLLTVMKAIFCPDNLVCVDLPSVFHDFLSFILDLKKTTTFHDIDYGSYIKTFRDLSDSQYSESASTAISAFPNTRLTTNYKAPSHIMIPSESSVLSTTTASSFPPTSTSRSLLALTPSSLFAPRPSDSSAFQAGTKSLPQGSESRVLACDEESGSSYNQ